MILSQLAQQRGDSVVTTSWLKLSQHCTKVENESCGDISFRRFLGMITYLGKFIPNFAEVTSPLRTLLKKYVEFKLDKPS